MYLYTKQLLVFTFLEPPRSLHYTLLLVVLNKKLHLKNAHFADFEQVITKISHFADFEQATIKISHFADLLSSNTINKSSNTINKTPLGETGCLSIFFFWGHCPVSLALHPSFSGLRLPPALNSTLTLGFFLNTYASSFLIPHVWLMGHHATAGVTHTHLRKRRISLGVAIILSICLRSHT